MKIYINNYDNKKTLTLHTIKYRCSTLKYNKIDALRFFVSYDEDMSTKLEIAAEFYKYLDRTEPMREVSRLHLDTKITSIHYIRDIILNEDENGVYFMIPGVNDLHNVVFASNFCEIKDNVKAV